MPGAPASYADYAAAWEADNAINGFNNLFNHRLVAYRAAVARLARYRLADGQNEITATDADDNVTVIQPAIAPLPATVDVPIVDPETGEPTGVETVPNPLIVQDDAERAQAQAVIDATPADVLAFDA